MALPPDNTLGLLREEKKRLLAELLTRQSSHSRIHPLSLPQQRLWFLDQLEPANSAFNLAVGLRLKGSLHQNAIRLSIQEIVNRHEVLRARFDVEHGDPVQLVVPQLFVDVAVTDLSDRPSCSRESELSALATAEVRTRFELYSGPLFRARLFRLCADEHVLVCTFHHIVCDGWSLGVFVHQLRLLYEGFAVGQSSTLRDLPVQYGDYARWQRGSLSSELLRDQIDYWRKRLCGAPAFLDLPTDRPRPPEQTFEGASQTVPVEKELVQVLRTSAHSHKATLFMLMLAAFKVLVHRYTGSEDIVVGVPIAGRNQLELEDLIGFFVNTVVLRTDLSHDPRFCDLLVQVREVALDAFAHADVPFERVVEELQPPRTLSYNPIFQVMFAAAKAPVQHQQFGGLTAAPYVVYSGATQFDLSVNVIEGADEQWWAQVEYNTCLFDHQRISTMLGHYVILLRGIAARPESHISDLVLNELPPTMHRMADGRASLKVGPLQLRSGPALEARDPLERILMRIWQRVLGLSTIGATDNFFDLGGHSLLAVRLMSQVQKVIGRKIPLSTLFRGPTVASFAEILRQGAEWTPDPLLMEIQAGNHRLALFAIAPPGVETLGYALLARHMGPEQPVYKIQSCSPLSHLPYTTEELRKMALEYILAMRAVQPEGPYCLGAACGGVHIAEQMVLELEAQHHEVGLLVIIDTWVLQNRQIRWLWRVNYYSNRLRSVARMPVSEQFAIYRQAVARRAHSIVHHIPDPPDPWAQAFWPGKDFQPRQFRAPVLLFKRPHQPYYHNRDRQMGWGARSTGGVEVVAVDSPHEEMLREPYVRTIGAKVRDALRNVDSRAGDGAAQRTPLAAARAP